MRIAQHFNAGWGLNELLGSRVPTVETVGYYRASQRDLMLETDSLPTVENAGSADPCPPFKSRQGRMTDDRQSCLRHVFFGDRHSVSEARASRCMIPS